MGFCIWLSIVKTVLHVFTIIKCRLIFWFNIIWNLLIVKFTMDWLFPSCVFLQQLVSEAPLLYLLRCVLLFLWVDFDLILNNLSYIEVLLFFYVWTSILKCSCKFDILWNQGWVGILVVKIGVWTYKYSYFAVTFAYKWVIGLVKFYLLSNSY